VGVLEGGRARPLGCWCADMVRGVRGFVGLVGRCGGVGAFVGGGVVLGACCAGV